MKLSSHYIIICIFFVSLHVKAQLQSFTIGNAIDQGNNCFTITLDQLNQAGGAWFNNPIDFDQDFTIYYQNNFGTKDGNGADGMALVFKTNSTPEIGGVGGGMGYQGISNSLIVEFDTFQNSDLGDPTFDHVSIQRFGDPSHLNPNASLTSAVPISNDSPNVEDGIDHEVKIVWEANAEVFSVFFDCEFVLSLNLDIKTQIFNGDDSVFFGFVGSTGGLSNLHQVCFNSISFVDDLQLQDETICNNESITVDASLPSGASYSWSPTTGVDSPNSPVTVISPSETTTYTVTILDNCGESSTEDITITVLDTVIPVFDSYPDYNIGDNIPPLPTTSNNGISGSWTPEINNVETTTYTFTPDDDQCATIQTLTIIINSIDTDGDGVSDNVDIDDDNDGILDINEGLTSTSNEFQQTFGTGGTLLSNTNGDTNTNVLSGDWYEARSTDMPFFWCQTESNGNIDGSGNINGRYLALDNNTQTLVYQQTGIPVIANVPLAFSVRVANLEGSGVEPDALLRVRDANGIELGSQNLVLPNSIVDQWQTVSLNFIPSTNSITIEIENQETGIVGNVVGLDEITVISIITETIDTDNDGIPDNLDLDSDNDGIPDNVEAQFSLGYVSPSGTSSDMIDIDGDGLDDNYDADTNSPSTETSIGLIPVNTDITDEDDYINDDTDNDGFPDIEENGLANAISVPFADSDNDGIDDVFDAFDGFDVNNNIEDPTTDLPDCDSDVFEGGDLDYRQTPNSPAFPGIGPICEGDPLEELPTLSNNNISGSWSPPLDNTQTTVYTFTPDDLSCGSEYLLEIIVNPPETPTFNSVGPICSGDELGELPTTSNNGITGTWSPAIDNTQTTTYTFTPNEGQCANPTSLQIEVIPNIIPAFEEQPIYCNSENIEPLPTTSQNGIEGSWSPEIDNTQTTTYTFTPNDGECGEETTLTIEIVDNILPEFNIESEYCIGDDIPPLPNISENGFTGTWSPEIDNTTTTTYTFTPDEGQGCIAETTFTLNIDQGTIPVFEVQQTFCEGDLIEELPLISSNGISGNWSPELNVFETTTYTFTPDDGQCALNEELVITVNPVNDITLNVFLTSAPFDDSISVELQASGGNGNYEYRVNNGTWQPSNTFDDLQNNTQYIFEARQINSCSNVASDTFTGLSFPDFFTPNGDGINDYWNIRALRNQADAVIYIFDRYGKLLVQVNPIQIGWDGNYSGRQMPSQDYWFLVEFRDERTGNRVSYSNHFTLKR